MIPYIFLFVFCIVSFILFYRIQIGFALVICVYLLVLPKVKIQIGIFDFYLYNSLIIVTWLAFLVNLITKKIPRFKFRNRFFRILLLFTFGLAILIPFAGELDLLTHYKSFLFNTFFALSLAIIAWHIYYKEQHLVNTGLIFYYTAFAISIYGIYCYITISNPYITMIDLYFEGYRETLTRISEERGGLIGRVQGTMNHAITWGGACTILFYYFLSNNIGIKKVPKLFVIALLSINVILSGSRSALLFLIIGGCIFFVFSKFKLKIRIVQYSVALILIIVIAVYQVPSLNRYSGLIESTVFFWDSSIATKNNVGGSSMAMRTSQLEGAFDMISGYHLFAGLGQGYIGYYFNTFGDHPVLHGFESLVFMALVNSGVLGLLFWVLLFYKLFALAVWVEKKIRVRGVFNIVLLKAYVISYFVFALFTGFMNTQILFFVIYALMMKSVMAQYNNSTKNGVMSSTR